MRVEFVKRALMVCALLTAPVVARAQAATVTGDEPVTVPREDNPAFALNLDGQQVGNTRGALNQPRYSRDTIAEFEFVSKNQQCSAIGGGPIVRDRVHYFGNYEFQRTPLSAFGRTPYQHLNITLSGKETIDMMGGGLIISSRQTPG